MWFNYFNSNKKPSYTSQIIVIKSENKTLFRRIKNKNNKELENNRDSPGTG
jgi:hypothetical protein